MITTANLVCNCSARSLALAPSFRRKETICKDVDSPVGMGWSIKGTRRSIRHLERQGLISSWAMLAMFGSRCSCTSFSALSVDWMRFCID